MLSFEVEQNLEMRLVEEVYSEELYTIIQDDLGYLYEWMPWVTEEFSVDLARGFIKRSLEEFRQKQAIDLFINKNKSIIGVIGAKNIDLVNRSAEIGYWLAKKEQGNGVITKCCRELLKYVFSELNLNRIVIRCATENTKSQAIPKRLGFTEEGVARDAEWLHHRFVDLANYSLLKEEWKGNNKLEKD